MFSCNYCTIFKNNYFVEHPLTAASVYAYFHKHQGLSPRLFGTKKKCRRHANIDSRMLHTIHILPTFSQNIFSKVCFVFPSLAFALILASSLSRRMSLLYGNGDKDDNDLRHEKGKPPEFLIHLTFLSHLSEAVARRSSSK